MFDNLRDDAAPSFYEEDTILPEEYEKKPVSKATKRKSNGKFLNDPHATFHHRRDVVDRCLHAGFDVHAVDRKNWPILNKHGRPLDRPCWHQNWDIAGPNFVF